MDSLDFDRNLESNENHSKKVKEQSIISVTVLPDDVCEMLEKNSGTPCLKVVRQRFDEQQKLVDHNIEYWLHNAIEMIVEGQ